jgi:hypothetical protein
MAPTVRSILQESRAGITGVCQTPAGAGEPHSGTHMPRGGLPRCLRCVAAPVLISAPMLSSAAQQRKNTRGVAAPVMISIMSASLNSRKPWRMSWPIAFESSNPLGEVGLPAARGLGQVLVPRLL